MRVDIGSLIHEVYRQSKVKRVPMPFVTRVVKLIYLADLEWHRRYSEPLANLEWRFLHYGPYAYEFVPILGNPDMEVAEFEGKTARRFAYDPSQLEAPRVPQEVSSIIGDLVARWGDADVNRLLDYVYFETEPMERARRGELLDFSSTKPREPEIRPELDSTRIRALRARLTRSGLHIPAVDVESQRAWDDEGAVTLPVGLDVSQDVDAE